MTETIYGADLPALTAACEELVGDIETIRKKIRAEKGSDPVNHTMARIKTDESMREKCRRKGLPETADSALSAIHDAIGVRVVCPFRSDIYLMREAIRALPYLTVVEEKDYVRHAKPNGYRSYHMIVKTHGAYYAEIQLRTISMDTWAALEHQMKYKKDIGSNLALITAELKRCADELASTDITLQTIHDMIYEDREEEI